MRSRAIVLNTRRPTCEAGRWFGEGESRSGSPKSPHLVLYKHCVYNISWQIGLARIMGQIILVED